MPNMSSDQLRDIAVAVVEDFLNNKVLMSMGLAKQAAAHELNTDQIQRCVEASNTVAHLRLLRDAEDRTFEFPLCKFAEVMEHIAVPDIEKSAGVISAVKNTFKDAFGKGEAAKALHSAKGGLDNAKAYLQEAKDLRGKEDSLTNRIRVEFGRKDVKDAAGAVHAAAGAEQKARNAAGLKLTTGAAGATAAGVGAYGAHEHVKAASDESAPLQISEQEARVYFIKEAAANDRAIEELEGRAEAVRSQLIKIAAEIAKDAHGLDKIACVVDAECVPAVTALVYGEVRSVRDFGSAKDGLFKQAELKQAVTVQHLYKEARAIVREISERKELQKRAHVVQEGLQKEAIFGAVKTGLAAFAKNPAGAIGAGLGQAVATPVAGAAGSAIKGIGKGVANAVKGNPKKTLAGAAVGTGASLWMNSSMLGHDPGVNQHTGKSRDVWQSLQG